MRKTNNPAVCDLVLLGGGHSHVQVVKMLGMHGPPDLRITLISEGSTAFYSGMLPGCVAGLYTPKEIQIELRPLARWAGARFIEARATGIDHRAKIVSLQDRPGIPYDVLSINVGSTTRGMDIPGVREFALKTRPISRLLEQLSKFEAEHSRFDRAVEVVVVGAGAAGVELACGVYARFAKRYGNCRVTLVDSHSQILEERGAWTSRLAHKSLAEKNIAVRVNAEAARVDAGKVYFKDGRDVSFDLLVWAAGGAAPDLLSRTELEKDEQGFLRVQPTLQTKTSRDVFAAGDCVTFDDHSLPKSGVYAVREGPYLAANILAHLREQPLEPYKPQKGFLALLMTGDGSAIASWKGIAARGQWVWRWKDHIDRRFMNMFVPQLIGSDAMHSGAPLKESSPTDAMRCAGCGGKVGGTVLSKALSQLQIQHNPRVRVGLSAPDDAAVIAVPAGQEMVQTIDHFRAFLDDPYLMGRIAAIHAASDIFAMGGRPDTVLAFATLPYAADELAGRDVKALMEGMVRETNALGATLVGGHTSEGEEFSVGLVVNGLVDPTKLLTKKGLRAGDRLILTKPLGTGTILAADMRMLPVGNYVRAAVEAMLRSNGRAAEILARNGASAMTDVTGFGLAVHLSEMLEASGASAHLMLSRLPLIEGARWCFEQGVVSTLHDSNRKHLAYRFTVEGDTQKGAEILYDPQTSGGLLAGVRADAVERVLSELHGAGFAEAVEIGEVVSGERRLVVK